MRTTTAIRFSEFVLAVLLLSLPGMAQGEDAALVGTVSDISAGALPGVSVDITNVATNVTRGGITNERGDYVIENLPPGIYTVRVSLPAFKTQVREGVRLEVRQRARLDFSMTVGEIAETITVIGGSPVVETETADLGAVTTERQIKDLPLNERDIFQLARYMTGAVVAPLRDIPAAQPRLPGFNGQQYSQNLLLLDGTPNQDLYQNMPTTRPSPDAIQEFKVVTNNYSAEYGRVSGAVITMVSKSGTNEFHGSIWDYARNDALDANNFMANRVGTGTVPYKRHQFGATLGGPIFKDSTFFFFSYEGLRQRSNFVRSQISPTENERNGVFGLDGHWPGRIIYDPMNVVDGQRMPFPGNRVPSDRMNPVARAIVQDGTFLPPPPNQPPGSNPNYFWNAVDNTDVDKWNIRIDQNFEGGDQLWGRWTWQRSPKTTGFHYTPNVTFIQDRQRGFQVAAGYIKNFGPNVNNELSLYLGRKHSKNSPPDELHQNWAEVFGFDHADTVPEAGWGVPRTRIWPYPDIRSMDNEYDFGTDGGAKEVISWNTGDHIIKFGISTQRYKLISGGARTGGGSMGFDGYATAQIGGSQGQVMADFLLGYPSSVSYTLQHDFINNYPTKSFYNWFLGDSWRVTPNLTLTLGIRHEISLPVLMSDGRGLAFFELGSDRYNPVARLLKDAPVQPILGGPLEGPNRSPIPAVLLDTRRVTEPDYRDFAPRIGIAWRPFGGNRTALRVGYGRSFDDSSFVYFRSAGNLPQLTGASSGRNPRGQVPTVMYGVAPPIVAGSALSEWPSNYMADPHWTPGDVQNWSLSLQHELMPETRVEVAYVGNKGSHQFGARNFNVALPEGVRFQLPNDGATLTATGAQLDRRPYPPIRPNRYIISDMNTSYNSFQTRFERRFSDGLSLVAGYTWSKNLLTNHQRTAQNEYDRSASRTIAPWHAASAFYTTGIYELPFGRGLQGLGRQLLYGWELTTLVTLQSGQPQMEIDAGSDVLNIGRRRVVLPDRTCDGNMSEGNRSVTKFFDTRCFSINPTTYGNSVAFPIRTDGIINFDIGLMKRFALGETRFVEFRTEFFNVFNNVNFGPPRGTVSSGSFGVVTTAGMARQIQFALRIDF